MSKLADEADKAVRSRIGCLAVTVAEIVGVLECCKHDVLVKAGEE